MSQYTDEIHKTYPGLQCWVHLRRDVETGNTRILFFDMAVNQDDPVHVSIISPRDILICNDGFVTPALTFDQYKRAVDTGEFPDGYIVYKRNESQ